jgi:hypothetical protein
MTKRNACSAEFNGKQKNKTVFAEKSQQAGQHFAAVALRV